MSDLTTNPPTETPHRAPVHIGPLSQGAELTENGTQFRVWSQHPRVSVIVLGKDGSIVRSIPLEANGGGFFSGQDPHGRAGDLYKYQLGDSVPLPDPASRYQPFGVHGPSMVVDNRYRWTDNNWAAPSLRDVTIYELHIGTFTAEGTFAAAAEKLPELAELGVTAIEIMPVADFPGNRNWGYDGVSLYAPARVYGTPDDFRNLINQAHANGLAVILDVVYNHFGPDGNYLAAYHSDYFRRDHKTPWGDAIHFELPPVRHFFLQNIAYWMDEFHVDGFRLDATHAIADSSEVHILTQLADVVHSRGGFVIAEDDRNDPKLISDRQTGGAGLDGCWADDFHHVVNVMLTGNRDAYFRNYNGTGEELATTLEKGWLFTGQVQPTSGKPRGGDPTSLRPDQLVYCISNHDQVGNRAFGERLAHLTTPAAYRAASALLLLAPYTPLLFMGQEWAASAPFQYFTDHHPELGEKVITGRRREFRDFTAFRDAALRETIPSPQAEETFFRSKLNWNERREPHNRRLLQLYRRCLNLRRTLPALQPRSREHWNVITITREVVAVVYGRKTDDCCVLVTDLTGAGFSREQVRKGVGLRGELQPVLSSNDVEFSGEADRVKQPETILLQVA